MQARHGAAPCYELHRRARCSSKPQRADAEQALVVCALRGAVELLVAVQRLVVGPHAVAGSDLRRRRGCIGRIARFARAACDGPIEADQPSQDVADVSHERFRADAAGQLDVRVRAPDAVGCAGGHEAVHDSISGVGFGTGPCGPGDDPSWLP